MNKYMALSVILWTLLATAAFSASAGVPATESERARVSRQVGQEWIKVGMAQYRRGQYEAAEKSLMTALDYENYLTAPEKAQVTEHLEKAHKGVAQREVVLGHLRKARELVKQGEPIKARAHYEQARGSEFLTDQEKRQVAADLKQIDSTFDRQKQDITEIYNRSVALYRAGEFQKAREGFIAVLKYGLLVTPKGQGPEDFLAEIDGVLSERAKKDLGMHTGPSVTRPVTEQVDVLALPRMEAAVGADEPVQESREVVRAAEPAVEQDNAAERRAKVVRGYTAAVMGDAKAKTRQDLVEGQLEPAIERVRSAAEMIKENRQAIGEEAFVRYSAELKALTQEIIEAQARTKGIPASK